MQSSKFQWMKRIKSVEREHSAARFAVNDLLEQAHHNPRVLKDHLRVRDLNESSEHLEGTYTIRIFAEFETSLRAFWLSSRSTDPPSRTRDLLDGVGARRKIPFDQIQQAHAVREYRKALVHEREGDVALIPLAIARSHLCFYLSFLPLEW